jgi:hypothetical protein
MRYVRDIIFLWIICVEELINITLILKTLEFKILLKDKWLSKPRTTLV